MRGYDLSSMSTAPGSDRQAETGRADDAVALSLDQINGRLAEVMDAAGAASGADRARVIVIRSGLPDSYPGPNTAPRFSVVRTRKIPSASTVTSSGVATVADRCSCRPSTRSRRTETVSGTSIGVGLR